MIAQAGDHFAQGAGAYATPSERHLGIPTRQRDDENRAQEARFGARLIRKTAYLNAFREMRVDMQAVDRFTPDDA